MSWAATFAWWAILLAIGFSVGINLRGNPPKRTRKTKIKPAPQGQLESK